MIILIILIIVLLLSFLFINKTLKKKDNILEDVKLQENTIRNDGFALMLQKEDGTYEESTSSSWPTDMKFNSELSGCIDVNGNKIENSLSYDNDSKLVTLQTNKTSYCYVYFDIKTFCEKNETLSNCIIRNSDEGIEEIWNSPLEDDGYRYAGTDPNNYICFGTTDKDTCINDADKYMYRIIGVFEDSSGNKHVKLIKKEALNTAYVWHSSSVEVDWNESDLYKGLNGSYFLTNTSYPYMQDTSWTNKISTWNYTMTNTKTVESSGPSYYYETGKTMYLHELNRSGKSNESCHYNTSKSADCNVGEWKSLNAKISLMYASDFALSLGNSALYYTGSSNYMALQSGWIHIKNNDSETPSDNEWTMSRQDKDTKNIYGWRIHSLWGVYIASTNFSGAIRPVFYLESNVELVSNFGDGSINNPYIVGLS